MTQNTQTTAGRIRAQIYYQLHGEFYSLEAANEEVTRVANTIAAEIDALTRERDEARAQLDNAAREMGESMIASARLRAEVERLRPDAESWRRFVANTSSAIAAAARAAKESQP